MQLEPKLKTNSPPAIENNIYLNIFNGCATAPHTDLNESNKNKTSVPGRKIENQVSINISGVPLTDRISKEICFPSTNRHKYSMIFPTKKQNLLETREKSNSICNSQINQKPKVNVNKEKKKGNHNICANEEKKLNIQSQRSKAKMNEAKKLGRSLSNIQLKNKFKGGVELNEQRANLPFRTNRAQAIHKKIIPPKFKNKNKIDNKEKREDEPKNQEGKQHSEKIRNNIEKIREMNKPHTKKQVAVLTKISSSLIKNKPKQKERNSKTQSKEFEQDFLNCVKSNKLCMFDLINLSKKYRGRQGPGRESIQK